MDLKMINHQGQGQSYRQSTSTFVAPMLTVFEDPVMVASLITNGVIVTGTIR
jgi:hypothetical protein